MYKPIVEKSLKYVLYTCIRRVKVELSYTGTTILLLYTLGEQIERAMLEIG